MTKPTLVLVHGSWHSPEHYDLLIPVLEQSGYKYIAVALPSTQSADLPPSSLDDDTDAVRKAVINELDEGRDVIAVAHSYGGCPTNNALKGLDTQSRNANGTSSSVKAIIFLAAIPLPSGTSFLKTALGGHSLPIHDFSKHGKAFSAVGEPGPAHYFYNDLSPETAKKYSDMLRLQAWLAYEGNTSHAGYVDISSWYLYCEKDNALPLPYQERLVGLAEGVGAKLKTEKFDSSHSPFLSMPDKTGEFIVKVAKEVETA